MTVELPMPVLYDQDCGICSFTARVLARWDRRGRLEVVRFIDAERRGLGTELSRDAFYASMHVVLNARTISGADGIPHILERLPGGAAPARFIRSSEFLEHLVARLYAWTVRNRHRLGFGGYCNLPPPSRKEPR